MGGFTLHSRFLTGIVLSKIPTLTECRTETLPPWDEEEKWERRGYIGRAHNESLETGVPMITQELGLSMR